MNAVQVAPDEFAVATNEDAGDNYDNMGGGGGDFGIPGDSLEVSAGRGDAGGDRGSMYGRGGAQVVPLGIHLEDAPEPPARANSSDGVSLPTPTPQPPQQQKKQQLVKQQGHGAVQNFSYVEVFLARHARATAPLRVRSCQGVTSGRRACPQRAHGLSTVGGFGVATDVW